MESIKSEIQNYNNQLFKPEKEVFEHTKMRIWDLLCCLSDTQIIHETNKTKEQIKNIIKEQISTI